MIKPQNIIKNYVLALLFLMLFVPCLFGAQKEYQKAYNPEIADSDGNVTTLFELYKGKIIFLDFWASWCPPCRASIPQVKEFYEKNKDNVAVIGVNLNEDDQTIQAFKTKYKIAYPVISSTDAIYEAYKPSSIPMFVIISPDGNIVKKYTGFNDTFGREWQRQVDKLLNVSNEAYASIEDQEPVEYASQDPISLTRDIFNNLTPEEAQKVKQRILKIVKNIVMVFAIILGVIFIFINILLAKYKNRSIVFVILFSIVVTPFVPFLYLLAVPKVDKN